MKKIKIYIQENIAYVALIQAIIAMVGSLYYSEIRGYIPCQLCWYQRILIYPIVLVITVGLIRNDKRLYHYVFPLSVIGWLIAFYHVLLQQGIVPETSITCDITASCGTKYVNYFGFVSIPIMALFAFSVIIASMWIMKKSVQTTKSKK